MQERIRLRNTLIGVAAVSYLWRLIVVVFNPGMTFAIAYLRGMTDVYGPERVVLSGVVGFGAAIVLLVCVLSSSKASDRIMHAALAFTAGFAFEGFLDTLDYAFWFGSPRELTSSLQDAVAFVACCAALALSGTDRTDVSPCACGVGKFRTLTLAAGRFSWTPSIRPRPNRLAGISVT